MIGFSIPAFVGVQQHAGTNKALFLFFTLGSFAIIFEAAALVTGFPYGEFSYSDLLGPKLFSIVPVSVFFGWTPILIGCIYAARRLSTRYTWLIAVIILVCADLVIDPAATALTFWQWEPHTASYYGVPLQNFFGWMISGAVGVAISATILPKQRIKNSWASYGLILILGFWIGVSIVLQLYVPALLGMFLVTLLMRTQVDEPKANT